MSSSVPRSQRLPMPSGPRPAVASGPAASMTRESEYLIMAIEDSPLIREVLVSTFRRVGMPIVCFEDGPTALAALTNGEVLVPDLLLLDIGLPSMDGYEVAHILRMHPDFADAIIVMLSGHDGMWDRMRSKLIGAKDFISKPFRPSQVIAVVRRHLKLDLPDTPEADDE